MEQPLSIIVLHAGQAVTSIMHTTTYMQQNNDMRT